MQPKLQDNLMSVESSDSSIRMRGEMNPTTLIAMAAAVGDPIRLLLLYVLGTGPKTIGQLVGPARVTQSSVSYHVRRLREAGLVRIERQGRCTVVRRNERTWQTMLGAFSQGE